MKFVFGKHPWIHAVVRLKTREDRDTLPLHLCNTWDKVPAAKIPRWSSETHRISRGNNVPQILWHVNTAVLLQRNFSSITKMVCVFTLRRVTYSNACLKYCSPACVRRVCCYEGKVRSSRFSAKKHPGTKVTLFRCNANGKVNWMLRFCTSFKHTTFVSVLWKKKFAKFPTSLRTQ